MSKEQREMRLRLINSYQYHDNGTGHLEWKPDTPQYVKDLVHANTEA
jgi:hypothetical protein